MVKLDVILGPDAQERAIGRDGEPGDAIRIEHLCKRFADIYDEMLDWAAEIRGTPCNSKFGATMELLARQADSPINCMRTFSEEMVTEVGRIPQHLASNDPPLRIGLVIMPEVDGELQDRLHRELEQAWKTVNSE